MCHVATKDVQVIDGIAPPGVAVLCIILLAMVSKKKVAYRWKSQ